MKAQRNINTRHYWDNRFASGDWELVGGREQTKHFAEAQLRHLKLSESFSGTFLDFGCGLGDAFPVYRRAMPKASLIGIDISPSAVNKCQQVYGEIAEFRCGDHWSVPEVDVIIASNVLEHLTNDLEVARVLYERCKRLIIVVPYREEPRIEEHVNTYDKKYFTSFGRQKTTIFASKGWSQYGWKGLWVHIYIKNILRPIFGRRKLRRRMQIMYQFQRNGGVLEPVQ
ncbi:class I SAM-dependent methyltransferase [Methylolobus aquaticus]